MLQRGTEFNGYTIEATDGKVGTVSDFLFDDITWQLRWLVVDTGSWLSGRKILIHPSSLEKPDTALRAFPAALTRAHVEASPSISDDAPVSRQMEYDVSSYYGWNGIPVMSNAIAVAPVVPRPPAGGETAKADPHLRSIAEVVGYAIHAVDGTIGHLETFLIDDADWKIHYLVVDTANWWVGRHVLVAPTAVKEIDWSERFVRLDLTCYKIKGSPAWENPSLVDRAYVQVLRMYYGWDGAGAAQAKAPVGAGMAPAEAAKVVAE
jgi:hypothetical protein